VDRTDYELAEPTFRVETQLREPRNLLVLAGHIGLEAASQLRDEGEHRAVSARDLDVDWRESETVTASSLQVLLAPGVSLSAQGQTLRVTGDNPKVCPLLELAGLSTRLPTPELTAGVPTA
jgi:ABC-type transporter Mla MlaB component